MWSSLVIKTTFKFGIISGCFCCNYFDNISNILLANNPIYHVRTKHMEVHYHFIIKKVLAREINLIHVSIEDQVVNIFTKALGTDKLKRFIKNVWCTRNGFELEGECWKFKLNVSHGLWFNKLLTFSSISFFSNNDLNPYKPPSSNYY